MISTLDACQKKQIDFINMDAGGLAHRELILWSMLEVQAAKNEGLLDCEHATLMRNMILQLRVAMRQLYNAANLPISFFYVHFICLITAFYLPLFAITGGIKSGTGDESNWVTNIVLGLVVALQSVFVIRLHVLGQKISNLYGNDLVNLSVIFYIEFTWMQSNHILNSQSPPELEPMIKTEEELQQNCITIGNAWDGHTGHGLGPISNVMNHHNTHNNTNNCAGNNGAGTTTPQTTTMDDGVDEDEDDLAKFSQSELSVICEMTATA